jgi:hypothetical protein
MGMALENSGKPKLQINNGDFKKTEYCKIDYEYKIEENEMATEWSDIIFKINMILSEDQLKNP